MGQEFFIPYGQTGLLKCQRDRIQKVFDVKIALDNQSDVLSTAGRQRSVPTDQPGRAKVEITGHDHGLCTEARDYIASLSQKEQLYPEDILNQIEGRLDSLKEASGADIARSKADTLVFVGSQEQILKALSLIEETSNTAATMHDLDTKVGDDPEVPSPSSGCEERLSGSLATVIDYDRAALPDTKYPRGHHLPQRPQYEDYTRTTLLGGTGFSNPPTSNSQSDAKESRTAATTDQGAAREIRTMVSAARETVGVAPRERPPVVDKSDSSANPSSGHSLIYTHMVTLGYKCDQIEAALAKFGGKATMDTVLDHLLNQVDSSDPRISSQEPSDPETAAALADREEEIDENDSSNLRPVMIDGSNIAMSKGRNSQFDCYGIKIVVDYFVQRGHSTVIAFIPQFRKEKNRAEPTIGQEVLVDLEQRGNLVFTPSRRVGTRRIVSYDDRYILDAAVEMGGVVVSNDHFRDFLDDEKYRQVIEEKLLMYAFVHDVFMPSQDPLGKKGPSLDDFLKIRTQKQKELPRCQYGVNCTYGNQCKWYHPERKLGARTVTQKLKDIAHEKLRPDWTGNNAKSSTAPLPGHSGLAHPSVEALRMDRGGIVGDGGLQMAHTNPLPGHTPPQMGRASRPAYPLSNNQRGHMPLADPEQEMRRQFELWQLEKTRESSNVPQQHYSNPPSNQPSPMNSAQLLGGYQAPAYHVPHPSKAGGGSARGSPYSSPNSTAALSSSQESFMSNPNSPHASPRDPSPRLAGEGTSHLALRPGTVPFLPQSQRPSHATSSGSLLHGGGSYHHQHQYHYGSAGGSAGRISSAGSDPIGYLSPQNMVQRSVSLQEGEDNLQRTRQNIFNHLRRFYGSDLIHHVMTMYPRETDVSKIVNQLNKLAPQFNASRTDLR